MTQHEAPVSTSVTVSFGSVSICPQATPLTGLIFTDMPLSSHMWSISGVAIGISFYEKWRGQQLEKRSVEHV